MLSYSVLMSVYYKEKPEYLRQAIESMLEQTLPPAEFVVVCDGPLTDALDAVLHHYQSAAPDLFQIVRLPQNVGLGGALRIGVEHCRCEIIARMDSDDISLPGRMKLQLDYLENHPEVSVIGGQIQEFEDSASSANPCRRVPLRPEEVKRFCARRNPMNHVSVAFRKKDVLDVGNYIAFDKFEDYYLWARMLARGYQLANLDEVCVQVRVGDAMYNRRGGLDYFSSTLALERELYSLRLCSFWQFATNLSIRLFVTVLSPNSFRRFFYTRFLRK